MERETDGENAPPPIKHREREREEKEGNDGKTELKPQLVGVREGRC